MKHSLVFVICVAVLLIAVPAFAQVNVEKIGVKFSNLTYAAAGADTSASQNVAGARSLSLVITTADSAELDVVVQYFASNLTWTTVLTDSLITTVAAGATKEFSLKDGDSDLFDNLAYGVRVIVTGQATGCGVTTPTFTAKWVYKP